MSKSAYSMLFSVCILFLFSWTAWQAAGFKKLASYFPLYISLIAIVLAVIQVIIEIRKYKANTAHEEQEQSGFGNVIQYIAWFVGYSVVIFILGFIIATGVFLVLFLKLETKYSWLKTALSTAVTIILLLLFGELMNLYWPTGLLF